LTADYPTKYQIKLWELSRRGNSQSKIASEQDVTRQSINRTLSIATDRILNALNNTARINKLDVIEVNPSKGFLVGYSPGFQTKVFVIFSARTGIQMWYEHQGQCDACKNREECTQTLLDTAYEWGITISNEPKLPPTKIAELIFSTVSEK
jgi:hypothetical protein